jgi:hypothetical protein
VNTNFAFAANALKGVNELTVVLGEGAAKPLTKEERVVRRGRDKVA